jgi:methylmalonyl-CoA mutase
MATNLFDFDPVSSMETKIQFELKGADYNETLIWIPRRH